MHNLLAIINLRYICTCMSSRLLRTAVWPLKMLDGFERISATSSFSLLSSRHRFFWVFEEYVLCASSQHGSICLPSISLLFVEALVLWFCGSFITSCLNMRMNSSFLPEQSMAQALLILKRKLLLPWPLKYILAKALLDWNVWGCSSDQTC